MAIVGLSLAASRHVESDLDPAKGTPEATKFEIGTLDSRVLGHLRDKVTSFAVDRNNLDGQVETSLAQNEFFYQVCSYGLRGWSNFKDGEGNDIAYKTVTARLGNVDYRTVHNASMKLVPQAVIQELAQKILADNTLGADEGNASGAS